MPEYEHFLETIKLAAAGAVDASKPFGLAFGVVKKVSPLVITLDQKLELGAAQLILTNAVRDYFVDMSVEHFTEEEGEHNHMGTAEACEHKHSYKGRKRFKVHTGLLVGEKVLLLRAQGGQRYIVLDRVEGLT